VNPREAARLLGHAAAFDNRKPSEAAAVAWSVALSDVPLDEDTLAAVARFYGTPPKDPGERLWIQPHDVRTHRRAIRSERARHFVYAPPAVDEPGRPYLARYRQQLEGVASGRVPAPSDAPALTGPPAEKVAKFIAGIGRQVPDVGEVKRPGPGGVVCPKCSAPIGRPCRLASGRERGKPHPARVRVALGQPAATETEQDIERRRAAAQSTEESPR
jgi:hypothetical protein